MNLLEKIRNSLWVIFSFIPFLNGFGFMFIGFRYDNRNWIAEGVTYEFPWFFYIMMYGIYGSVGPARIVSTFATVLLLVSVIRSFWVAVKLNDVYENHEKYAINQTNLNYSKSQDMDESSSKFSCCICILCIFFIMAVMGIIL